MLTLYVREAGGVARRRFPDVELPLPRALWYDLRDPTLDEIEVVQAALGVELPTRDEMQEIESSSRLYDEGEALFMTLTLIARAESENPESHAVTLVATPGAFVTLRYADPAPFQTFAQRIMKQADGAWSPDLVFIGLLEAIVDRAADVLERSSFGIDRVGRDVFERGESAKRTGDRLRDALTQIGRTGTLISQISESLMSLTRATTYFSTAGAAWTCKAGKASIKTLLRDIKSLQDHSAFLSQKTSFLLDATLGLISIEQNAIVKIFTVASVAFLPPTLIASIYGMNFEFMPELKLSFGYPMAIGLMILSAVLPFLYFRRRGWL